MPLLVRMDQLTQVLPIVDEPYMERSSLAGADAWDDTGPTSLRLIELL